MNTHSVCFRGEIRKILCGYRLLFGAIVSRYMYKYFLLVIPMHIVPSCFRTGVGHIVIV